MAYQTKYIGRHLPITKNSKLVYDRHYDLVTRFSFIAVFRDYNLAISSFMTDDQIIDESNMTGAISGAGTVYLSEHLESPPVL